MCMMDPFEGDPVDEGVAFLVVGIVMLMIVGLGLWLG